MAAAEGAICKNCGSPVTDKVLRCGVCKKATYCSPACQKEDWTFHKRICKKPSPEEAAPRKKPSEPPPDTEEMKRQLEELTQGQDPAISSQVASMMAGMVGGEVGEALKPKPQKPPDPPCKNCAAPCSTPLRCGVCKIAVYCSAKCQKEDWQFHKRVCKKPAAAPTKGIDASPKPEPGVEAGTPAAGPPLRPKENEKVVEHEDVGTWYKHREFKPHEDPKDFRPSKLEGKAEGPVATAGASTSKGSAWNAAGTWEEKSMLPWWEKRLQPLQGLKGEALEISKVGTVKGEASIVHVRGQPKFMYDLSFDLSFSGLQRCKACARSAPGARCSNCVRCKGKFNVSDFSWDCEGSPCLDVKHEEADGPSHVKKASPAELRTLAEAELRPAVLTALQESVAEYKTLVASDGPKWASQLPPKAEASWTGPVASAHSLDGAAGCAADK